MITSEMMFHILEALDQVPDLNVSRMNLQCQREFFSISCGYQLQVESHPPHTRLPIDEQPGKKFYDQLETWGLEVSATNSGLDNAYWRFVITGYGDASLKIFPLEPVRPVERCCPGVREHCPCCPTQRGRRREPWL